MGAPLTGTGDGAGAGGVNLGVGAGAGATLADERLHDELWTGLLERLDLDLGILFLLDIKNLGPTYHHPQAPSSP